MRTYVFYAKKTPYFVLILSVFSIKHGKPVFFPKKTRVFRADQHGKNTDFSSIEYGSPYIDLNHLEKKLEPYFLRSAQ